MQAISALLTAVVFILTPRPALHSLPVPNRGHDGPPLVTFCSLIHLPGPAVVFPRDSARAAAILTRTADAIGGPDALMRIRAISLRSAETVMGTTVSSEAIIVYPDRYWSRFETGAGSVTMAVAGESGWLMGPSGERIPLPETQRKGILASLDRDLITIFKDWRRRNVRDNGIRIFEGRECHDLLVTGAYTAFHLLVNPDTFLPVALIYSDDTAGAPVETVELLADYKPYGDILLPSRSLVKSGGTLMSQSTILTTTINPDIDPSLFK
ncbi:hypothetical protein JXO52_00200 [bacterium]|nr:hypothetical protein [bacterium]